MISKLVTALFVFALVQANDASVLKLDTSNFDSSLAENKILFINFYADWCRFSQLLNPVFEEASEQFKNSTGDVLFASVDCDRQPLICQTYKITKYPTLKIYRSGKLSKKEYRGPRSVESMAEFVKKQVEYSVSHIDEKLPLEHVVCNKQRNIVGYFTSKTGIEYQNFQRVASDLRDDCKFHVGIGEGAKEKNPAGSSVFYRGPNEKVNVEYTGHLADYEGLLQWTHDQCIPLIREVTLENAEEITEESLPLLILFRDAPDEVAEKTFSDVVNNDLSDLKPSINFLIADGKKFARPLFYLRKSRRDLPFVAFDSLRNMYILQDFKDLSVPRKLRQFIEELNPGKFQRKASKKFGEKPVVPSESVFKKMQPSSSRYTLLDRDEL